MAIFKPPEIDLDKMKMYFGEPYEVNLDSCEGSFKIYQPTIGDIMSFGEDKFKKTVNVFTTNTTACRLMLYDMGIDWTEYKDYYLFMLLFERIDKEAASFIFHDFDITSCKKKIKVVFDKETGEKEEVVSLYDESTGTEINEEAYYYICQYLRYVFNINPERKMTSNPILKEWYIKADRREYENSLKLEQSGKKKENSSMQALISFCVNHPGFKYKLKELKDVGVCEFFDSVQRLKIYEVSSAIMKGIYGGFIDGKTMKAEVYDFAREL